MSKTDSKDWNPSLKSPDSLNTDFCIPWSFRTRRKNDPLRIHLFNVFQRDPVTSLYLDLPAKFLKISFEIIYKRIIIIDHQIHIHFLLYSREQTGVIFYYNKKRDNSCAHEMHTVVIPDGP